MCVFSARRRPAFSYSDAVRKAAITALLAIACSATGGASQDPLERLLSRMSSYLVDYEKRLSAVVAEERYDQWIDAGRTPSGTSTGKRAGPVQLTTARTLVSDFLMIRWPGNAAWFGFRDVLLVDGKPVRDREERLLKLFTDNPADVLTRADLIAAESARYNIGGVARNINVPTQALDFLHPRHRSRFTFELGSEETIEGTATRKTAFEERQAPYLISTPSGRGVKATGTAWIDPADGSVVQTELNLNIVEAKQLIRTRITVKYRHDKTMDLRVPVELLERHEQSDPSNRSTATTTFGRAEYRNFRRFGTETREQIRQ